MCRSRKLASVWKNAYHGVAYVASEARHFLGQCRVLPAWENLNADLSALREFDSSYKVKKGENGFNSITYHSQAGMIEIISHPYMMDGDAFSMPKSCLRRVGATDIDFVKDEDGGFWRSLDTTGYAGYQAAMTYEFQFLISEPAKCVYY